MANPFERLAPEGFHKVAQNDNMSGEVLAVVYYNKTEGEFFVQVVNADKAFTTLGPMKAHVFENLTQILSDVRDMDRKYSYLD